MSADHLGSARAESSGLRVLVTRPRPQAAEWVQRLRQAGLDAVALPLIEIASAPDPAALAVAWSALGSHRLLVFVSPNAAQNFFAAAPPGARWPSGVRAASPGPGTTAALAALGVPDAAIIAPGADAAQFDSEALWARLKADDWHGASVLVVRGSAGRDWLAARLTEHGARVTHLAAYERCAPLLDATERERLDAALAEPATHVWLVSSSEAIDRLEALVAPQPVSAWPASRAIATHPRIAERARRLGFGDVRECRPDAAAVIACIQSI